MKDFIIYVTFVFISVTAMLSSAWLSSRLQPVASLDWVGQSLSNTVSHLFAYVVAVWLFVFFIAIFHKKLDKSLKGDTQSSISITSTIIAIVALVALPLTLIVWQAVKLGY